MIQEHHIDDKSSIALWFKNHPDREVFNKFSKYKGIIKEEEFLVHSRESLELTREFMEYNRQYNEFYIEGIDLILLMNQSNMDDNLRNFILTLPIKSYFNMRSELLDVFYNTYLNRINRDKKINEILE